jgi:hypothetical protein
LDKRKDVLDDLKRKSVLIEYLKEKDLLIL